MNEHAVRMSIYELDAVDAWARRQGLAEHGVRRLRAALFKHGRTVQEALANLPAEQRVALLRAMDFHVLELTERHHSQRDGATKLIFRTRDGLRLETVILRIASGRTSVCISSQVGCAAGCAFCATAKMGLHRNLTQAEMVDQVIQAQQILQAENRRVRNVVFMGMGEPLHNERALYPVLRFLRDPRGIHLSERHLLVSTVGMAAAMARFVEAFPNVRLALSLHSARQEIRKELMPSGKSQRLDKLQDLLPALTRHGNFMVEYVLLRDINDGPEDLAALIDWLQGYPVHINLIQFNAHPGSRFQAVSAAAREAFGAALRRAGFKVTLRYSLGDDIAAACGQLAGS